MRALDRSIQAMQDRLQQAQDVEIKPPAKQWLGEKLCAGWQEKCDISIGVYHVM